MIANFPLNQLFFAFNSKEQVLLSHSYTLSQLDRKRGLAAQK